MRNVADRLSQPLLTSTPNLFDRRRNRERNANVIANVEMEPSSDSFGPINRTEVVSDKCGKLENLYKRKKHENDVLQKENIQLRKMQIEFNSKIQLLNEVNFKTQCIVRANYSDRTFVFRKIRDHVTLRPRFTTR